MTVSTNEKCKIWSQGVMWGSRPIFGILGPPYISGMKHETANLAQRWTAMSTNEKNTPLGQKGSCGVT